MQKASVKTGGHGGGKGHGKATSSKGGGKGKSTSGKGTGKDRESGYAPPSHLDVRLQKHPDAHMIWEPVDTPNGPLYYWRINAHVYECCAVIGGPTIVLTWDQISSLIEGREVA